MRVRVRVVCVLGREAWLGDRRRSKREGGDVQPRSSREPPRLPELLSPGCQKFPVFDIVIASAALVKVLQPTASLDRSYSSTSSAVRIVTRSAVGLSTVNRGVASPAAPRPFGNDKVARSSQTAGFAASAECSSLINDADRIVNLAGASTTVLLLLLGGVLLFVVLAPAAGSSWPLLCATASASHGNLAHRPDKAARCCM